jgi:hypothetical protein
MASKQQKIFLIYKGFGKMAEPFHQIQNSDRSSINGLSHAENIIFRTGKHVQEKREALRPNLFKRLKRIRQILVVSLSSFLIRHGGLEKRLPHRIHPCAQASVHIKIFLWNRVRSHNHF